MKHIIIFVLFFLFSCSSSIFDTEKETTNNLQQDSLINMLNVYDGLTYTYDSIRSYDSQQEHLSLLITKKGFIRVKKISSNYFRVIDTNNTSLFKVIYEPFNSIYDTLSNNYNNCDTFFIQLKIIGAICTKITKGQIDTLLFPPAPFANVLIDKNKITSYNYKNIDYSIYYNENSPYNQHYHQAYRLYVKGIGLVICNQHASGNGWTDDLNFHITSINGKDVSFKDVFDFLQSIN